MEKKQETTREKKKIHEKESEQEMGSSRIREM